MSLHMNERPSEPSKTGVSVSGCLGGLGRRLAGPSAACSPLRCIIARVVAQSLGGRWVLEDSSV